MREITTHHTNEANKALVIKAIDREGEPVAYQVMTDPLPTLPGKVFVELPFQRGPIKEVGINGITLEVLLAIARDKLERHQFTKHACTENDDAIAAVVEAAAHLESRTKRRTAEGVEGTHMLDKGAREADVITPADVGSVDDVLGTKG